MKWPGDLIGEPSTQVGFIFMPMLLNRFLLESPREFNDEWMDGWMGKTDKQAGRPHIHYRRVQNESQGKRVMPWIQTC